MADVKKTMLGFSQQHQAPYQPPQVYPPVGTPQGQVIYPPAQPPYPPQPQAQPYPQPQHPAQSYPAQPEYEPTELGVVPAAPYPGYQLPPYLQQQQPQPYAQPQPPQYQQPAQHYSVQGQYPVQPPGYPPQMQQPAYGTTPPPYGYAPHVPQQAQPQHDPYAQHQQQHQQQQYVPLLQHNPQPQPVGAIPQPQQLSAKAAAKDAAKAAKAAKLEAKAASKVAKAGKSASASPSSPRPISGADATVGQSQRVRFIRLTYLHLLLAILAFAGLEYLLMTNPFLVEKVSIPLVRFALGGRWNWGVVLAAFMAVSFVADYWASHATSRGVQYAGLGFYIIAEALIFVPLLAIVEWKTHQILARGGQEPHIIRDAAFTTMGIFSALTLSVFITKKDFSYLRSGLIMASGAALMLIVMSLVFGFNLGLVFSIGMVLLAAGYILYQTSQVLAHYDPRQHVAASLALFSSVALMFWYVIRIFMRARE